MSDWIDDEKRRRDAGERRALDQSQHAAVNARYPGCTLEHCFICDEETGRAGRAEDSIYCCDCDLGPFCEHCIGIHQCTFGTEQFNR